MLATLGWRLKSLRDCVADGKQILGVTLGAGMTEARTVASACSGSAEGAASFLAWGNAPGYGTKGSERCKRDSISAILRPN